MFGADGEVVAEEAGLGECGMIERGTVELGFLLAATSRHSLFPLQGFLPHVALLPTVTTLSFCQDDVFLLLLL